MSVRILLDMDGVLADFNGGMIRAHGVPDPYRDPANRGKWGAIEEAVGSPEKFWSVSSFAFWAGLGVAPGAHELVHWAAGLVGFDSLGVLSSPCKTNLGACVDGKLTWLAAHFPAVREKNVIFSRSKAMVANSSTTILIDDYDVNVREVNLAGGIAFLWPSDWNVAHGHDRAGWVNTIKQEVEACVRRRQ